MNNYFKIISKRFFYAFLIIIVILLLFLSLESCKPEQVDLEAKEIFAEDGSTFASFMGSALKLIDTNGGDLYPGEIVQANIKIINSGIIAGNNIGVKLIIDDLLIADLESISFVIESLDPGKSIEHNLLLKVLGEGLSKDTPVFARLSINEGNNEEFFTNEESLLVFGVHPYERGKIPIIGLHAVEDEIEIPIELYTHHFDALCKTLKNLGFETITFKDLLNHLDYGRVLP